MKFARLLLAGLLLGGPAVLNAEPRCYAFWSSQCFEIRDARSRDITHHVIITRGPVSLAGPATDCDARLESSLSVDERDELLEAFNDILEDIDGCNTIDRPPLKAFADSARAIARYRRLTRQGSHTQLHEIDAPKLGPDD